jgi:protein gp37
MGQNTTIEWADHTFSPWWGCTKVSAACDHCYAQTWARRWGVQWGPHAERRIAGDATWENPHAWNRKAKRLGRRYRVFCASMADVFENRPELEASRARLWQTIRDTPRLDWLLLTKRPQMIQRYLPADWGDGWPNVRLGTTVENQAEADRRIPHLLAVPAAVRFLSCEPLLGPMDLRKWLSPWTCADCEFHGCEDDAGPDGCGQCGTRDAFPADACKVCDADDQQAKPSCPQCGSHRSFQRDHGFKFDYGSRIDWVIAGGESGPGARPSHPDWFRSLRNQCQADGVAYFHKQNGEWLDERAATAAGRAPGPDMFDADGDPKGPRWHFYDPDDRMGGAMIRVGKRAAGRLLDGREHNEAPRTHEVIDA